MPRPLKPRTVGLRPEVCHFKPRGVPSKKLKTAVLTLDEFEAIRLADYEGLSHEEAAILMNISRPTFSRLVEKARVKVAGFIVNAEQLVIEGGNVEYSDHLHCPKCKQEGMDSDGIGKRAEICSNLSSCELNEQETVDAKG
ncbi:DUF134 domain-containing protein [Limisalsivibrio acetivorans]|uniref:DUF134 domain-containing protein n=1 Tax=Limisalsivibrio acetivorans TaxID=1304888 RepID=UPI0003B5EAE3|nr:DUF134 domain-containing protein [Limisalsivibrio acetivorans]